MSMHDTMKCFSGKSSLVLAVTTDICRWYHESIPFIVDMFVVLRRQVLLLIQRKDITNPNVSCYSSQSNQCINDISSSFERVRILHSLADCARKLIHTGTTDTIHCKATHLVVVIDATYQ